MKLKYSWKSAAMIFLLTGLISVPCSAELFVGSTTTNVVTNYTYPTCTIDAPARHNLGERMVGGEGGAKSMEVIIDCSGKEVPTTVFGEVVQGHSFQNNNGPAVSFIDSKGNDSNGDIYATFKIGTQLLEFNGTTGFCSGLTSRRCGIDTAMGASAKLGVVFGKATAAVKFILKYD
ncbi:hypothetical protein ID360_004149 [Salmonella enterica]|nr:hypothetical protein [Salmonella enterica]ELJ2931542.1 hypothetical protein [Salmonella enterica subsp. enterica]EDJ4952298.1 hypothetical protein [Salmonella enterica]EGB2280612.1 hypothetical protein [Salmonella enterica]EGH0940763.1 hypothetical protein [Salmonella enterica]